MTINQAIIQTWHDVSENYTRCDEGQSRYAVECPSFVNKRIWLRDRRIMHALQLLGVDSGTAWAWTKQPGRFDTLVRDFFRKGNRKRS